MKSLKEKGAYLLLGVLMLATLGIIFYRSLSYHYELQGNLSDLSGCQMEFTGYEVTASPMSDGMDFTAVGKDFHVTGEDPQLILTLPAGMQRCPYRFFMQKSGKAMRKKTLSKGISKQGKRRFFFRYRMGNTARCVWMSMAISGLPG